VIPYGICLEHTEFLYRNFFVKFQRVFVRILVNLCPECNLIFRGRKVHKHRADSPEHKLITGKFPHYQRKVGDKHLRLDGRPLNEKPPMRL
jgi:hypothetical protein